MLPAPPPRRRAEVGPVTAKRCETAPDFTESPFRQKSGPSLQGIRPFQPGRYDGSGWRNVKSIALGALWPPRLSAQWPENTAFPQDGQTAQLRGHWASM